MSDRLVAVEIDEQGLPDPAPEMERERRVAIFDLIEANRFALRDGPPGPYRLRLGLGDHRITFDVTPEAGAPASFHLALGPLDQATKDYAALCGSYGAAVRSLPPDRIGAIDAVRRGIHDEAARQLQARLARWALVDQPTARRLFTLVCAMTAGG